MKCSESFGVPDTTIPASPADWSLTRSNHVEPLPLEKIFRIRAGVDRLDRHHEPHPVDRGDHPATPRLRQFDPGLGLDQWGVGQRVGLHPQVVLVDVGDPVAGELPGRGDRAIADVQRVRGERRGENHLQVAHAGLAAGDRVERLDHLRVPRHDFQDQFADVDRREHLRDPAAQVDQARWFVQRVQGRDVQPVRVVDGDRGVRVERAATSRYIVSSSVSCRASSTVGSSGNRSAVSTAGFAAAHFLPVSRQARGRATGSTPGRRSPGV